MQSHAQVKPEPKRIDYQPDMPYYLVLESHLADSNGMSTRTFPKLKPQKYDPEALARSLAKAKAEGAKKGKDQNEEEYDYHK